LRGGLFHDSTPHIGAEAAASVVALELDHETIGHHMTHPRKATQTPTRELFSDADAEFLERVAVRLDIINGDRMSDETIKLRAMAGAIRCEAAPLPAGQSPTLPGNK
jgi:hypothetical protein